MQNDPANTANDNSPGPGTTPINAGSGEATSTQPSAGLPLQGMSEVSDSLGLADDLGKALDGFVPGVHATNPDGTPRLKKGGGYQLKRGRRGNNTGEPTAQAASVPGTVSTPQTPRMSNKQAAGMLCGMIEGGAVALLGKEWETDESEAKGLLVATQAYLEATGGLDISPSVGLLVAYSGYGLPRLAMPETQSRLGRFGQWVAGFFRRKK